MTCYNKPDRIDIVPEQTGRTVSTDSGLTRRTMELQVTGELLLGHIRNDLDALHPGRTRSLREHYQVCEALALFFEYLQR
jgi:hypothetical protein